MVFPVFWMISTAFKPDDEIVSLNPTWVPLHPTIDHFRDAINRPYFWQDVKNSLIVVLDGRDLRHARVSRGHCARELSLPGAHALHRPRDRDPDAAPAGLIIPLYVVLARYHQVNALTGLIVTYMTFVLPFCVWTLRGFLLGIPKDLEEAAMVDGRRGSGCS